MSLPRIPDASQSVRSQYCYFHHRAWQDDPYRGQTSPKSRQFDISSRRSIPMILTIRIYFIARKQFMSANASLTSGINLSSSANNEIRVRETSPRKRTSMSTGKISSSAKTRADDDTDYELTNKAASRSNESSTNGKVARLRDTTSLTRDSSLRTDTSSRS